MRGALSGDFAEKAPLPDSPIQHNPYASLFVVDARDSVAAWRRDGVDPAHWPDSVETLFFVPPERLAGRRWHSTDAHGHSGDR